MAFAGITLVCGLILFLFLTLNQGVSASCQADGNEVVELLFNDNINVITNIPVVPRCIRCGYIQTTPSPALVYVTDPNNVSYVDDSNGQFIINTSISGVTIFNDGLLVEDPASSFSNDNSISCRFSDGSNTVTCIIRFIISDFLPPPITPNGTVLDYVEGDNVTLTCTGSDIFNDRYQWTLPNGSTEPPASADKGLDVELNNVNRADSGVYNCTGTISGESISVVSSVTLNIQYPAQVLSLIGNSAQLSIGSLLTLNCSFEGNPTPTISWSHNGNIILSQNITDHNYALLEIAIDACSRQSFGEYTCSVSNSLSNSLVSNNLTYFVNESDFDISTMIYPIITVTTITITTVIQSTSSTLSNLRQTTNLYVSNQPTMIMSELQNGSLPSYGVILVVLLSIISVLSITIIIIILVVWYWKRTKATTKSSTVTAVAPSSDVIVDDNSAYGMRDIQLIREQQQTTGNEVIYEPPIASKKLTQNSS